MPYIESYRRAIVEDRMPLDGPGELNYAFTERITSYIRARGLHYQTINDILGALEGAKLEFYRRVAVPYEEKKREANGDVYG